MARVGSTIGSIRLVSVLGRGGMGEVYQGLDETLQRQVAVKALRGDRAVDSDAKARFLHEARILSSLHHPNICLVHDYIEHDGDAYLVMEKVDGSKLHQRIADGLDRRQKLDVAIQLADALTAAHARGIIHRDLKPGNVMLKQDGTVKVLDFGIARLEGRIERFDAPAPAATRREAGTTVVEPIDTVGGTLIETRETETPRTAAGTVIGTPAYMSPEQARGEVVSPASDVFSLGLILQYLFTGLPARDPQLPTVELIERARRGESRDFSGGPAVLAALIRQMKADNQADRPAASSIAHRLRRMRSRPMRRVRFAVAAVVVVVAIASTVKYTSDLRHERSKALAAQASAQSARDEANAVNEFLVTLLGSAAPGESLGDEVTVREVLDRAAAELPGRDDLDTDAKVRFLMVVGSVYRDLGRFDSARSALDAAVGLADREGPVEAKIDAQARIELGRLEAQDGSLEAAAKNYRRAAEIVSERLPEDLQARAVALTGLGHIQVREGRLAAARASYGEALDLIRKVKPAGDPQIGLALGNLGFVMMEQGEWADAGEKSREAMEIFAASLGPDHPVVARAANNVAICEEELGRLESAYEMLSRVVEIREKVFGPDHPDTGEGLVNLAGIAIQLDRLQEAEEFIDRAGTIVRAAHGDDHPRVVLYLLAAAELAEARGDLVAAESITRESYAKAIALEGVHSATRDAERRMLDTLLMSAEHEEAVQVARATLERRLALLDPGEELVGEAWVGVARAASATGDEKGALDALESAVATGITADDLAEYPELADLVTEK